MPSEKRKAKSESRTAKLALGTVQFGLDYGISNDSGQTSKAEVKRILEEASSYGVKTIDTARAYGNSEEVLGQTGVHQFDVVTKLNPAELHKLSVKEQVQNSLQKLNITQLYGLLFHNAESALTNPEAVNSLQKLKEEGLVKKTGYSLYTPDELNKLLDKYPLPDIIQVPFNILDKRFEPQLVKLHNHGVETHTRSTFLQGLFFMKLDGLDSFFNPVKPLIAAMQRESTSKQALASYLLQEVLQFGFIDKVVIGVNTADQLWENISGLLSSSTQIHFDIPKVNDSILMPNLWP
jgi:aryl-alcohol dehydrogenase-like predicted oxidoreductase